MKLTEAFITVTDHEAAKAFYTDVLGFSVVTDYYADGFRWLELLLHPHPRRRVRGDQATRGHDRERTHQTGVRRHRRTDRRRCGNIVCLHRD